MPVEHTKSLYARTLKETVYIRRFTGVGPNRPFFDTATRGRVTGYEPTELVGSIVQGDRKAVVNIQDLVDAGFALPITKNDKIVDHGDDLAVLSIKPRRDGDYLAAVEIQARGQG